MYACPAKNILEKGLLVSAIISRNDEIRQNGFCSDIRCFVHWHLKIGGGKKLFGLNYRTDDKRYVGVLYE